MSSGILQLSPVCEMFQVEAQVGTLEQEYAFHRATKPHTHLRETESYK